MRTPCGIRTARARAQRRYYVHFRRSSILCPSDGHPYAPIPPSPPFFGPHSPQDYHSMAPDNSRRPKRTSRPPSPPPVVCVLQRVFERAVFGRQLDEDRMEQGLSTASVVFKTSEPMYFRMVLELIRRATHTYPPLLWSRARRFALCRCGALHTQSERMNPTSPTEDPHTQLFPAVCRP